MQKFPLDLQWRPLKFHYKRIKISGIIYSERKSGNGWRKCWIFLLAQGWEMIFSCTGCEGWDQMPRTHIPPNTDPHHRWPRWLWFTHVCFRLDRLYSKIHRVQIMLLIYVTWICHGSAGTYLEKANYDNNVLVIFSGYLKSDSPNSP